MLTPDTFGRVQKLFVDRDGADPATVRGFLQKRSILLVCGPEVAYSPTFQAAVLTAANVANRCFPGTVRLDCGDLDPDLRVPWPAPCSLREAVSMVAPSDFSAGRGGEVRLLFGTVASDRPGLRVTFDGWSAGVGPSDWGVRLQEREYCTLAGVAAGSLAVAEVFFEYAGVNVESTRRLVGLSLWRPDLSWESVNAVGLPVEYLPGELWLLGLGHLGQGYLWCLGMLPFAEPAAVNVMLNDFDRVVQANLDTGLLSQPDDIGRLKTRVAARWLDGLGFRAKLVERPFDHGTKRNPDEPTLALCGPPHERWTPS